MHKFISLGALSPSVFVVIIVCFLTFNFVDAGSVDKSSTNSTASICSSLANSTTTAIPHEFPQSPDFSFFVLSMQWPFSVCATISPHTANVCRSPPTSFTVRGLWPTASEKGQSPTCCGMPFSTAAISDIAPALRRYWPDLSARADDVALWKTQWLIHGSCSGLLQRNYFRKVLELSRRYAFLRSLNAEGIVASLEKDHDFNTVQRGVNEAAGGHRVHMRCVRANGHYYLDALQVCLHRGSFSTVDCPHHCIDGNDDCCSSNEKIRIPYWRHAHSRNNTNNDHPSPAPTNASYERVIMRDLLALAVILVIVSFCMYKFFENSLDGMGSPRSQYRRLSS